MTIFTSEHILLWFTLDFSLQNINDIQNINVPATIKFNFEYIIPVKIRSHDKKVNLVYDDTEYLKYER